MNARFPAAAPVAVTALVAALGLLGAGCEDPSLRVSVIRAPAYADLVERVEVSVYQRDDLTCDDIAFDKLSAEELRSILKSTGAGDLDAIPRLGKKAVVARGYGRATRVDLDEERLIIAGCAEVDEIAEGTGIEIETEPVATAAIDSSPVVDGKGAVNIAVIAVDANQEGIDGKEVRWTTYAPSGGFPASGDIDEPAEPVVLRGGEGVIRPATPALIGPYAVQVRIKWSTGLPPPVNGMMDDQVMIQRTLGQSDSSFINSCAIYTRGGLPTLACLEKDSVAARFVRSYRLSGGELIQVAPEVAAPDVLGIFGAGAGVVTVKGDGSYAGILGSSATGNVCQNGCPAGAAFNLNDVLGFGGCGSSGPVLFAYYRDVLTARVTGTALLTGEKYAFNAPTESNVTLSSIGCVTDLEMGGAARIAAAVNIVPSFFDRTTDRTAIYMVGSPIPVERRRDRRLAGTGFSTSGNEARLLTTEVDPNGFIVVESVMNRPATSYRLFERRRSPAVAPPRHYVSGSFDLDDAADVAWDVFDDPETQSRAIQIILGARPGRPALLGRLPLTDAADLLTADLDGDGMSEIIGYGPNALSIQRFGALNR
jgi:hypothetical protein